MPPETCPNCGADVPRDAKACPQCGSDEQTGWSDDASTDGLNLPDEKFNYDDFVKREFGGGSPVPRGIRWWWWLVAVALLALLLLFGI
ncbi:MAG TPA: zinc ribbon domain-containing protein [Verrucomicrobiae bacterium]